MAEHKSVFRDYLRELPHQWLLDNLISGFGGRSIVSSSMINEAAVKFAEKSSLTARFKALPPELRVRCAVVYLMGKNGLSLKPGVAYSDEPLLPSLLVFAAHGGTDGSMGSAAKLFGFEEFEPVLRPLMAEALAEAGVAGEERTPQTAGCPWRPLNDVAALCSLALHGVLKRNTHGGLARTALNALKQLVNDPTLTGKSIPEAGAGHPAGFLIWYCLREGLIIDAEGGYLFGEQAFAEWSKKSVKERLGRLADYADSFLGGFSTGLLRELLRRCEGRWISANALVSEAERPTLIRALGVFEFLGRLHANNPHGAQSTRFAPYREADGNLDNLCSKQRRHDMVVMSDFSVIIPQEATPDELIDFSAVGRLTAFDKVYKGEITKAATGNSLSAGIDEKRIKNWLRGRRAPTNVTATVDEWIREFSRLFMTRDATLITSEAQVAKAISGFEPLRKHLVKVNAHTVFRVRPGSEKKVAEILEKLGFDTRAPGKSEPENRIASVETKVDQDLVYRGESRLRSMSKSMVSYPPQASSAGKTQWKFVTDFTSAPAIDDRPAPQMRRTKYGSGLKKLDATEMMHVVDYALLTGYPLIIDYAGSASIKENVYTVSPLNLDKGIDPAIEAEIPFVRGRKRFYLDKINRIGVAAQ